jgi:tRNA threonylcarbamoyladenosine biosynthesis protein TsaB
MNILCLDTVANNLSLAVKCDADRSIGGPNAGGVFSLEADTGGRHSESLIDMLKKLFETAGIEPESLHLLGCLRGPGSFTGVRLGFSAIKGIGLVTGAKLVSYPTLDCMASPYLELPLTVIPALDARRNQFYTAIYRSGKRATDFLDIGAEKLRLMLHPDEKILLVGPDAEKLKTQLEAEAEPKLFHMKQNINLFLEGQRHFGQAKNLLKILENGTKLLDSWDGELSVPIYVRKSDAEENAAKH